MRKHQTKGTSRSRTKKAGSQDTTVVKEYLLELGHEVYYKAQCLVQDQ